MLMGVPTVAVAVTVTVTDVVLLPFAFVAVSVYCVVAAGATGLEGTYVTSPTPLFIETEVAPETLQESVTCCPAVTVSGVAEKELIVGTGEVDVELSV